MLRRQGIPVLSRQSLSKPHVNKKMECPSMTHVVHIVLIVKCRNCQVPVPCEVLDVVGLILRQFNDLALYPK